MDVVISATDSTDLSFFLEAWRPILRPYHLIIIVLSSGRETVQVHHGCLYDLYTQQEIAKTVGIDLASALTSSLHACDAIRKTVPQKFVKSCWILC